VPAPDTLKEPPPEPPQEAAGEVSPGSGAGKQEGLLRRWLREGGTFLMVSLILHGLLLLGAAVYVVQTVQSKRKLNFSAAPPAAVQGSRQLEYRVQTAKRTATMSPPPMATRVTTSAAQVKVALPEVALPPAASLSIPNRMGGLAGSPAAFKPASQALSAPPAGAMSALPAGVTAFGFKLPPSGQVSGLRGVLYYMRSNAKGEAYPESSDRSDYLRRVEKLFGETGKLNEGEASAYLRFGQQLVTNVILFPSIPGDTAPKAFGVPQVPGDKQSWVAVYKAKIYAESPKKRYRFLGGGNEVLLVRVDGKLVLDGCYSGIAWSKGEGPTGFRPKGKLAPLWSDGRKIGDWVSFGANGSEIEVVLGEGWGGAFGADLCVEEEGVTYSGEQRPLFKIEGYQKALTSIQPVLSRPEAAAALTLEGPTFKMSR
jgi:hypothetical protein